MRVLLTQAGKNITDYAITINIQDIFMSIFWILLSLFVVYLIFILAKVYSVVKEFRNIARRNNQNIDKILNELPGITKNVNGITDNVNKTTTAFMPSVENIAEASKEVTQNIKENNPLNEMLLGMYSVVKNFKKLVRKLSPDEEE